MTTTEKLRRWKKLAQKRALRIGELQGECRALADLASDTPRFFNPLHVSEAKAIRDKWLKS
jgi:hypothetical protein